MLTILIPVLKSGYLESQLIWLDKQTHKDFTCIAMDVNYKANQHQAWAKKQRTFNFIHVPLVHNIKLPKRVDYSVKNNLALLAPTDDFLFLSDTHYPAPAFVATVTQALFSSSTPVFEAPTVLSTAYDGFKHTVDAQGATTHKSKPVFVFNRKLFFYGLNGFDEALTSAAEYETMSLRMLNTGRRLSPMLDCGLLYHIHHTPESNTFGTRWRKPCEKCDTVWARWKFDRAYDIGSFPVETIAADRYPQWVTRDPELGIEVFQCRNCGFGGAVNPTEYENVVKARQIVGAPTAACDGRAGRDLSKVYETMVKQVSNNIDAKLAYLMTTY